MSRTAEEVEEIVNLSTQRDWLYAQREFGMSRKEISEDEGVFIVFLAYLFDRKVSGSSDINKWLDTPTVEVVAFLDIEDDDSPKVPTTNEPSLPSSTTSNKPTSV